MEVGIPGDNNNKSTQRQCHIKRKAIINGLDGDTGEKMSTMDHAWHSPSEQGLVKVNGQVQRIKSPKKSCTRSFVLLLS